MGLLDALQVKKGDAMLKVKKFDEQIAETESKIGNQFKELGMAYYKKHRNDDSEEYKQFIQTVRELEQDKAVLEKNKLAAQGLRECDHCHQIITLDSAFCNKCGAKLEAIVLSSGDGKFCQACGASLDEGDSFCTSCGAKIV